jgi:hypothetical protein
MIARSSLTALVLVAVLALPALADWKMIVVPAPGSQIEITNAVLIQGSAVSSECVSFVNHAPQAVKRIVFVFTKLDAQGVMFGRDVFDRRGSFDAGGSVEGMRSNRDTFSRSRVMNCHDTDLNRRTPDAMRVEITTVEYADGTTWTAPIAPTATPPPPTPAPPATPEPTASPEPTPSP